jgi:antirestriction protein ArdC
MAKYRRTAKDRDERAAKLADVKARLDAYEADLDDDTRNAIVARFHDYSPRNALLIAMQAAELGIAVSDLDGYRTWQQRGRQVRKGTRGIVVLAPAGDGMSKQQREQAQAEAAARGQELELPRFFRLAYIFDIAQTDALEQPADLAS